MLYMLTINGNQYGCYTTRANAVAALTDVRTEGVEGEADIKQVDNDHDSELVKRWEVYPWLRGPLTPLVIGLPLPGIFGCSSLFSVKCLKCASSKKKPR